MTMNLLELPDCVLEEIFKYLSYDDIAKKRLVSTKINTICQSLLNRAFVKLESRIASEVGRLKPFVPRKQSQRRKVPAYQKIRYLERIELNVRLLYNIYSWYIDIHLCCFIPGKVIDTSLNLLRRTPNFWLDDDTLDVLLDEVCMAEEHFREEIEPTLKKLKAQKENASVLKATKPPVLNTQSSVATTQSSAATTQSSVATTQSSVATTQSSVATTQSSVATTQSSVATTQSSVATAMQKQQNSNKCQFQDNGNCRKAYLDLNKKYNAVNYRSQAIKKELTNTRKEMADLRRRLGTLESQKRSAAGEQTERNHHHVRETVVKKVLRSSKRLAEAKKAIK